MGKREQGGASASSYQPQPAGISASSASVSADNAHGGTVSDASTQRESKRTRNANPTTTDGGQDDAKPDTGQPSVSDGNTRHKERKAHNTPSPTATADGGLPHQQPDTGQAARRSVPSPESAGSPPARESRASASNRWIREGIRAAVDLRRDEVRRECLAAGMRRHEALERSWEVVLAEFPPPGVEPAEATPPPKPLEAQPQPEADLPPEAADPESGRLVGLADIPPSWPALPPNAPLQSEIQWVQAVRIDVVEQLQAGGYRIRLQRADSPAPSKAALSWLETAVLFPAKFADVAVKTTAALEDDRERVRRERRSIEEVRAILAEVRAARDETPR